MSRLKQMHTLANIKAMRLQLAKQRLAYASRAASLSKNELTTGKDTAQNACVVAETHMRDQMAAYSELSQSDATTFYAGVATDGVRKYNDAKIAQLRVATLYYRSTQAHRAQRDMAASVVRMEHAQDQFLNKVKLVQLHLNETLENDADEEVTELTALKGYAHANS